MKKAQNESLMTDEQFSALAELIRSRGSASEKAARLVLVEGWTPRAASEHAGITPQGGSNALSAFRRGRMLANIAVGHSL